jgi:ribosomal protein S18 acetylase RimI-like enzyme
VESTGFFRAAEIEIAVELVSERLSRGEASGYHFLFAQKSGRVLGYTCFGPIPGTLTGHDLYWIAVRSECRRQGVGSALLRLTERAVRRMGGRRLYADTSSQPLYEPTRSFYVRWGFIQEALLRDYYAPGDHKAIYVKVLAPDPPFGRRPWRR